MSVFHQRDNVSTKEQRFSLLLLEPSEFYVDDASVYYYPESYDEEETLRNKQYGRLKICSKSLVFDPSENQYPILRIPFRSCTEIGRWEAKKEKDTLLSRIDVKGDVLSVKSKQVIKMKENNIIGPYDFTNVQAEYKFAFNYTPLTMFLPDLEMLYKCSTSFRYDEQKQTFDKILQKRERNVQFDYNWFDDVDENAIIKFTVRRIDALTLIHGRVLMTNSRLYFQPFNNISPNPVVKERISNITRVVPRRYLLRDLGLEIYFDENKRSVFYAFLTIDERDRFKVILDRLPGIKETNSQENIMQKWQRGDISNYEYLMYLNTMADRSFNDLTQYPVFPWIISDYQSPTIDLTDPNIYRDLSKPIGALNPERLELFWERYENMPKPKFMYGTHYSSPGYVLFYLVRQAPEYMLCLQSGKFDSPDRLFNNMQLTWENVLRSPADVKELIPEFYDVESEGFDDFLINTQNLPLGVTQDRKVVNDVVLPPWAQDGKHFIQTLREALESDYVSQHIHEWIDLIFGYKQRGKESVKSANVFYHLTYEGAIDIDAITDPNERAAMEMQISEFGQTPKQLFLIPHPHRFVKNNEGSDLITNVLEPSPQPSPCGSPYPSGGMSKSPSTASLIWSLESLNLKFKHTIHKGKVTGIYLSKDGKLLYSISNDYTLKIFNTTTKKQIRRLIVCDFVLSCLTVDPITEDVIIGAWDNNLYFYSMSNGRIMKKWPVHDDAVNCCKLRNNTLITGSWDATVKMFENIDKENNMFQSFTCSFQDHFTEITCLDIDAECHYVVSGTEDGTISVCERDNDIALEFFEGAHIGRVNVVVISPDGKQFISAGEDCRLVMRSLNGDILFETQLQVQYTCLEFDGQTAIMGTDTGQLHIWDMVSRRHTQTIDTDSGNEITCIHITPNGNCVAVGAENGEVFFYATDAHHPEDNKSNCF